jgi:hypothetical protein
MTLVLAACGAGSGEGLDQNGQVPSSGGSGFGALAPTLDSIQANVFSVSCAVSGCHRGGGAPYGLQLEPGLSAGNLINVPAPRNANLIRVVPGDPDASFLIQKLQGIDGLLGDRMPDGGPYLSTATVNVIRQWVQDGAPP